MARKNQAKRTAGQRAAFGLSKILHIWAGAAGVCEEISSRSSGLLRRFGNDAEVLQSVASVIDRGDMVEKEADEAAKAACDSVFGPEAEKAKGNGKEEAQASA